MRRRRILPPRLSQMQSPTEIHHPRLRGGDGAEASVRCCVMKQNLHDEDVGLCVMEGVSAQDLLAAGRVDFIVMIDRELRMPLTWLPGSRELPQDRFAGTLPSGAAKLIFMVALDCGRLLVPVNDNLTFLATDRQRLNEMERVDVEEALADAIATNTGIAEVSARRLIRLRRARPRRSTPTGSGSRRCSRTCFRRQSGLCHPAGT